MQNCPTWQIGARSRALDDVRSHGLGDLNALKNRRDQLERLRGSLERRFGTVIDRLIADGPSDPDAAVLSEVIGQVTTLATAARATR